MKKLSFLITAALLTSFFSYDKPSNNCYAVSNESQEESNDYWFGITGGKKIDFGSPVVAIKRDRGPVRLPKETSNGEDKKAMRLFVVVEIDQAFSHFSFIVSLQSSLLDIIDVDNEDDMNRARNEYQIVLPDDFRGAGSPRQVVNELMRLIRDFIFDLYGPEGSFYLRESTLENISQSLQRDLFLEGAVGDNDAHVFISLSRRYQNGYEMHIDTLPPGRG
ncbi:MAG: hypothetical protein LBI55_01855 [Oscillospiraceae bacterium]|jgi:hypothetical protein|nr:hypothetical protein [Oscillospiraceae bacterium]